MLLWHLAYVRGCAGHSVLTIHVKYVSRKCQATHKGYVSHLGGSARPSGGRDTQAKASVHMTREIAWVRAHHRNERNPSWSLIRKEGEWSYEPSEAAWAGKGSHQGLLNRSGCATDSQGFAAGSWHGWVGILEMTTLNYEIEECKGED